MYSEFGTVLQKPGLAMRQVCIGASAWVRRISTSSAHQCGKASGVVGGNFPYWTTGGQAGKYTCYAEYVGHSSVIATTISGGVQHNMACAKLGTSGLQNSWHTRESWHASLVKLAQKVKKMANQGKKFHKTRRVAKNQVARKGQQNILLR